MNSYSIAVAGGGSWGTALANLLVSEGHKAILWLRDESKAKEINLKHENTRYLPGLKLHPELSATSDPQVLGAEILILAIPLQNLRSWLGQYASFLAPNPILCNAAKGLEIATQLTAQGIINECLALRGKTAHYAVISGPSFAVEVIQQLPTAVVLATDEPKLGLELRSIFSGSFFRCYSSSDVIGVELGGALKNVIAIAAGVLDGLRLGHNSRAALVTRGLAEIKRIGCSLGAFPQTFMGLSGLGDLTLTATGDLSRNRRVGLGLGQGQKLEEITQELGMVAEGIGTTKASYTLSRRLKVDSPLTDAVYDILYNQLNPSEVLKSLLARKLRHEDE